MKPPLNSGQWRQKMMDDIDSFIAAVEAEAQAAFAPQVDMGMSLGVEEEITPPVIPEHVKERLALRGMNV